MLYPAGFIEKWNYQWPNRVNDFFILDSIVGIDLQFLLHYWLL
jgi:hypothetical protein